MPTAKPTNQQAIQAALSNPRMSTYLTAASGDTDRALELYGWNARISAALMLPAHFAEVTTRNAADDALTAVYGLRWPWDSTFEKSPPVYIVWLQPAHRPTHHSVEARHDGQVIAELIFVFWQKMFTSRHDIRVWNPQILGLFPNATEAQPAVPRLRVYNDLDAIRQLRNRIAHHGPISTGTWAAISRRSST